MLQNLDSAKFEDLEHTVSPQFSNPITSQLPEKNDMPILGLSGILTNFEKPDQAICILD